MLRQIMDTGNRLGAGLGIEAWSEGLPESVDATARPHLRFENGYRLQLDVFNLLNSKDHQIDYFQEGRLRGDPLEGVMDVHFKPVEPFAVRLTFGGTF